MLTISRLRLAAQILCFLLLVYLGYFGVRLIEWKKIVLVLPTLSCYYTNHRIANCFLRSLQEELSSGWKSGYTNLIPLIVLFLIFGIIFGRSWCSWVCPVGFFQDIFIRIRKLFKISYCNLSDHLKTVSVFVGWFFLISLFCIAAGIGIPNFFLKQYQYDLVTPFCQICPGKQIFPCIEGRFKEMLTVDNITALSAVISWLAIGVFIFYVTSTLFIRRMWCRVCPMGILLGYVNKISFLSLRKEGTRCTKCGICLRSCPVQVNEVYEEKEKERIDPLQCTLCFRCVEMCPEKDALKIGFFKIPLARSAFRRFIRAAAVKVK